MASIESIKASDGSGNANVATVQSIRAALSSTIVVDTVLGINTNFMGSMGTPHTFTDPITSETITVISEATCVDFAGHVDGANLEIDTIAPGYTDLGSAVGDIVIIRPTTQWADNVAAVLDAEHTDDGTHDATIVGMLAGTQTFTGAKTFDALKADTIAEKTAGAGVTVDNLQIKDNTLPTVENVPIAVNRQDDTTNNVVADQLIQSGWGWQLGEADTSLTETVTFPIEFTSAPIVYVCHAGYKIGSTPANIGELTGEWTAQANGISTSNVTATDFKVTMTCEVGLTFGNTVRVGYSWIAIGTKTR